MTRPRRRLPLPDRWMTVQGLHLGSDGLHGTVLDEAGRRICVFEGVRVITADVDGWSMHEVIAGLSANHTPAGVEPQLAYLAEKDLEPMLACGALTKVDALRLMGHVPGWRL